MTHKIFAGFHFVIQNVVLFIFLFTFSDISTEDKTAYLLLIFSTIYSFSSIMDGFKWSIAFEFIRVLIGISIIIFSQALGLSVNPLLSTFLLSYFLISAILNFLLVKSLPQRKLEEIS